MRRRLGIMILLLAGVAAAPVVAQPMAGTKIQEKSTQAGHQGAGKVVSVDRAGLRIKLAHEPIKSLGWSAMTMDFNVANVSLLDGLKEGDAVQFELGKTKPEEMVWVIVNIRRK